MKTTNWLTVIKQQEVKKKKLHDAQLCMAGHCTTTNKGSR